MNQYIAEFIGTFLLILLGCGTVANAILKDTKGNGQDWLLISVGWGLAVFIAVVVTGPVSGAHINPAVSVGLAVAGLFPWAKVAFYIIAQMLGAMTGAFFVWLVYRHHFNRTEDQGAQLGTFATGPQIRKKTSNFISEFVGTFVLVFAILYIAGPQVQIEGVESATIGLGSIGALPVALLVTVIGIALGGTTGYAINPARDLGPRIMHALLPMTNKGSSDWSYSWIPIFGPLAGAVVAAVLYLVHNSIF